ncbi:hypothetical protein CC85DRAFT_245172 [Cutaneotrichosporon oleaginosum]|uniref:RPA43 OB domain-containing protein n=1 Tax=Cutaneotrichosporon oleaginosum TaxID=879819 RepID=A0A0J1B532_9TREE|nr:uncharacterized protein CC85DRAFT_245172 [Cutaneotrichosporon oleaginosum]KLT42804.1 hypothetical protein CC85DRAFT_245172 [Cutaneotrichosporon oleaginosum]TXT08228.1 hypothetical protein COLE_05152 [Cutaneotrichosporon oleaginosum]
MRLSVPPKYAADWLAGVTETLDGMLMRYVSQMGGVLLAHWNHEVMDDTVKIVNECPYGVCEVSFHSIIWAPVVGQVLYGTHSLSSPSHLSLLFAKTFNVSIPLQHIPRDKYEFEHADLAEEDYSSDEEDEGVHEVGRWKEGDKVLGEGGERVAFTVIGLHVTNQMLSLTGSLLDDPSKPQALPETARRSPSPDILVMPKRTARTPRTPHTPKTAAGAETQKTAPAAPETPAIDESKLSARELKKLRKEQEKAKRDARKARKADGEGEDESSLKRKADEEEGPRKKRK